MDYDEFTEAELAKADIRFDDDRREITIIVSGAGGDLFASEIIKNEKEYFI